MSSKCVIRVAAPLDERQLRDIQRSLERYAGHALKVSMIVDESIIGGFIAMIDNHVIDRSFKTILSDMGRRERQGKPAKDYTGDTNQADVGQVTRFADGIVSITGMTHCRYGELVYIGDAAAIAMNISENDVDAVLLSSDMTIEQDAIAQASGDVVRVPVGEALLGRVVDPLGRPLDGMKAPKCIKKRPIEAPSPSIHDRQKVAKPLMTGILSIDSMIPIGRGQRELIIGDRQTGKTTIAIDTILNQRDKNVLCVYVAIGQKASTIADVVNTLREHGALDYTVVVASTASDSAPMQYIAPYAGCAMAEEFMYEGRDVLIVYDDLSKHAVAYRAMSLLLRRPPGREAYPGDVFYLHSRLLERAARLSDELGGGSMTALPIIETMADDISAYIPTNVISITDGQIYLESELFNEGMRPAVNVGLSVSRVGGSAQTKAMRKVAGRLRLDLAQYRELSVFSQFAGELESSTREALSHGQRVTECLKQTQHMSYTAAEQIAILHTVLNNITRAVPVKYIAQFNNELLAYMRERGADVMDEIGRTGVLTDDAARRLEEMAREYMEIFFKTNDITPEREERDLKLDTHTRTNASAESAGKKQ